MTERRLITPGEGRRGRVHKLIYSYKHQVWFPACRAPGAIFGGTQSEDTTIRVTCVRCQVPGTGKGL